MTLHRIVCFFLTCLIVIPVQFITALVIMIFTLVRLLFNHYSFWNQVIIPQETYNKLGNSMFVEIVGRIAVVIAYSIQGFIDALKEIKEVKF